MSKEWLSICAISFSTASEFSAYRTAKFFPKYFLLYGVILIGTVNAIVSRISFQLVTGSM
jgi:hypothetical protein